MDRWERIEAIIKESLKGIDQTETDGAIEGFAADPIGWWETTAGAEFGAEQQSELLRRLRDDYMVDATKTTTLERENRQLKTKLTNTADELERALYFKNEYRELAEGWRQALERVEDDLKTIRSNAVDIDAVHHRG